MSDDPTRRLPPASEPRPPRGAVGRQGGAPPPPPRSPTRRPRPGPDDGGPDPRVIAAALIALAAIATGVVVFLLVRGDDREAEVVITAQPMPTATPTQEPTVQPTSPTPDPTTTTPEPTEPTPEDTAGETPSERDPGDADAAAFSSSYRPPRAEQTETVTVDLNADGWAEVVFASVVDGAVRVDVAAWDGTAYQVVFVGPGGEAAEITDLFASDFTGGGTREVVTQQRFDDEGRSLSIWGWDAERGEYRPLEGRGGCFDGSHTFGAVGATITRGEIRATCDDSPLPRAAWSTAIYRWDADSDAWAFEEQEL